MNEQDPITIARLTFLAPEATAKQYSDQIQLHVEDLGQDVLRRASIQGGLKNRTRLARQDIPLAMNALHRMLGKIATTAEQRENLIFLVAKLVDDAVNIGAFYMAGQPDDSVPAPMTASAAGAKGGKNSSIVRRDLAKDLWQNETTKRANLIIQESPTITQEDLARRLLSTWPQGKWKPKYNTLIPAIRKWEKEGSITTRMRTR